MARQGYYSELKCKQENAKIYGKLNVMKMAIGGSSDFLIAYKGKIIKFIEVKETTKKAYYPRRKERLQFGELVRLGKHHQVPVELWIYFKRGKGKPAIKHVRFIYEKPKTQETSRRDFEGLRRTGEIVNKQREKNSQRPLPKQNERQEPAAFREGNS